MTFVTDASWLHVPLTELEPLLTQFTVSMSTSNSRKDAVFICNVRIVVFDD